MRPRQGPQCGTQRSLQDSKPWCQHAAEREATRLRHWQRETNCWPTETPKKLLAQGDPKAAGEDKRSRTERCLPRGVHNAPLSSKDGRRGCPEDNKRFPINVPHN